MGYGVRAAGELLGVWHRFYILIRGKDALGDDFKPTDALKCPKKSNQRPAENDLTDWAFPGGLNNNSRCFLLARLSPPKNPTKMMYLGLNPAKPASPPPRGDELRGGIAMRLPHFVLSQFSLFWLFGLYFSQQRPNFYRIFCFSGLLQIPFDSFFKPKAVVFLTKRRIS